MVKYRLLLYVYKTPISGSMSQRFVFEKSCRPSKMSIKFIIKRFTSQELTHCIREQLKQSVGTVFIMAQYFFALLVLCVSGSLGTTTKPTQQNTDTLKDLCQVSAIDRIFSLHTVFAYRIFPNTAQVPQAANFGY